MGIRIHKVLGYALTDVAEDDPRLAVGRRDFDGDGPDGRPGRLSALTVNDLVEWAEADLDKDGPDRRARLSLLMMRSICRPDTWKGRGAARLADHVHWGWRETTPGVLLFVPPPLAGSWARTNDDIDYYEEMLSPRWEGGSPGDSVRDIPDGIHPFTRRRVDRRTGRVLRFQDDDLCGFHLEWMLGESRAAVLAGNGDAAADFLGEIGFASHREFLDNVAPEVPGDLRMMLRFLGVFRDESTALSLRPVLWTYWA